jgi:hypothetical protein
VSTSLGPPRWKDELHAGGRVQPESTTPLPQPKKAPPLHEQYARATLIDRPAEWPLMR